MTAPSSNADFDPKPGFLFGEFQLAPDGTLLRACQSIHLPPKELAALRVLLLHAGQVVSPAQLKEALWGDVHVTPESIPRCISSLRARLGPEEWIQTLYKRGYRMGSRVQRIEGARGVAVPRLALIPFSCGWNVPEDLGRALADETTALLTDWGAGWVKMLARDSAFSLAERGFAAQQIGAALGSEFVLSGTLRCVSIHLRLRTEMIRVLDGTQIWVEDFLAVQEEVNRLPWALVIRIAQRLHGCVPADALAAFQAAAAGTLAARAVIAADPERPSALEWMGIALK